jgi:DNA-binding LacI/PurR family transcriptional regulator
LSGQQEPARPATIRDVARRAGVSVSTVSYVMNGTGPVAADTRSRVLAAIREVGFEPNQAARSLKRGRAAAIGLIVPDLRNEFFAMVAEGVQDVAFSRDVLVVLCSSNADVERETSSARLLRRRRVDGVVYLSGTGVSPGALFELAERGPVVFVDELIAGLEVPFVGSDNRRGARAVAEHVLGRGHRRLAVIGGPPALWTAEQRLAGYREAMAGAGLDPDSIRVEPGDYRLESGYRLSRALLEVPADRRPTALLCANDLMAMGALQHCRKAGIRVPEEVSVAGFDDIPVAPLLSPPLTTVRQPAREMGQRAAELLLGLLSGPAVARLDRPLLPVELRIRESVAPPQRS